MLSGASSFTSQFDHALLFILGISIVLLVAITFFMIYFVVRYHHSRNKETADIHGNLTLELLWTIIPTFLVLGMFYFGMTGYRTEKTVPKDAMKIDVHGRMWSWSYVYGNGLQTDTLYVPLDQPVKLNLISHDVIHSFYVPAFRVKQDVVPGGNTSLWFKAVKEGTYDVLCAEYCGLRHSYMLSKVVVLPKEKYEAWYADASARNGIPGQTKAAAAAGTVSTGPSPERGANLVKVKGCIACHSTDGSKIVGPSFKGLFGHKVTVTANGQEKEIVADEDYLRRSMLDPASEVVKGFQPLMPSQKGLLTDAEIADIIAYIKGVK